MRNALYGHKDMAGPDGAEAGSSTPTGGGGGGQNNSPQPYPRGTPFTAGQGGSGIVLIAYDTV